MSSDYDFIGRTRRKVDERGRIMLPRNWYGEENKTVYLSVQEEANFVDVIPERYINEVRRDIEKRTKRNGSDSFLESLSEGRVDSRRRVILPLEFVEKLGEDRIVRISGLSKRVRIRV